LAYVTAASGDRAPQACIFCAALDPRAPSPLVLFRGRTSFVILNLYPYNNGHVMVVPNRHVGTLTAATTEELHELIALTRAAELVLTEAYRPHGMNVGLNLGRPAGAGILDHLHIHLVPRWDGDTNFMSVVGNVRVVPEDPEQTARRLRPIFEKVLAS